MDLHKCLDCEQELKPNRVKGINTSLKIEGYERLKGQLKYVKAEIKSIENIYDRVLDKQKHIGTSGNDRELLCRIDTDCGRIVRMLQGKSTKDMDKIAAINNDKVQGIKPPLGLTPNDIWRLQRIQDIKQAMGRYISADKEIPKEWVNEYLYLKNTLK